MSFAGARRMPEPSVIVAGWPAVAVGRLARRELDRRLEIDADSRRKLLAVIEVLEGLDEGRTPDHGDGPTPAPEISMAVAAELLGVTRRRALELTRHMPRRMVGRQWLIDAASVEALVAERAA